MHCLLVNLQALRAGQAPAEGHRHQQLLEDAGRTAVQSVLQRIVAGLVRVVLQGCVRHRSAAVAFHNCPSLCSICPADNEVSVVRGIKGLASGVFFDNLGDSFLEVR